MGALATARVLAFGLLERRPHYGGSEGNDLGILLRNHATLQAPGGVDTQALLQLVLWEHHQPPLYYVGVPLLFGWSPSLSFFQLASTNAAALALGLWATWRFGLRHGGPRLALLAVLLVACLPGVAGRVTIIGVEPAHLALLAASLLLLLRLRAPDATGRDSVWAGLAIGAGLLTKLTFIAPMFLPLLLEAGSALLGGRATRAWMRRLLEAAAVVAVMVAVGFLPFASTLTDFFAIATTEPTHQATLSMASFLSLVKWLHLSLSDAGLLVVALAIAGLVFVRRRPGRGLPVGVILAASFVSLVGVHALIPHKELRYLVPVLWSLSVLMAMGLDALWPRHAALRVAVVGALLTLAASTFVFPQDPQHPVVPNHPDFERLEPPRLRQWLDRDDYYGVPRVSPQFPNYPD